MPTGKAGEKERVSGSRNTEHEYEGGSRSNPNITVTGCVTSHV